MKKHLTKCPETVDHYMLPLRKLIIPLILLVIAVILRPRMVEMYSEYGQLFEWLPYLSLTSALLLSAAFNLSRLFSLSMAMIVIYVVIQLTLQTTLDDPASLFIYTALSFSFSVLTFLILFIPERGLKNRFGLLTCAAVPLILLINTMIYFLVPEQSITSFINLYLYIKPIDGYILSYAASLTFLFVMITAFFKLINTNDDFSAISLILLLANFITFAFFDHVKISTIVSIAAGLALIISLLRSSYNMAFRDDLTGLLAR
jgi:hypothetical protein